MKIILIIPLLFISIISVGQVWVSGRLNYQPVTYFPKTSQYYSYHERYEPGVSKRITFETSLGYKFLYISYNTFTQNYLIPDYASYNDYELAFLPYYFRTLKFYDFIFGLRFKHKWITFNAYYNRSLLQDSRYAVVLIAPSNLPHPDFPEYRSRGHGFGINIAIKLIENLSLGVNSNYTYFKNIEEKQVFRFNPFLEYKYTFKW